MIVATAFAAGPLEGKQGNRRTVLATAVGRTIGRAIAEAEERSLPHGGVVGLDLVDDGPKGGPILTAYGSTITDAADEARRMGRRRVRAE